MRLIRALRMLRWTPLAAVVAAAACEHGDINEIIAVDGDTVIINISMSTQFAGGKPTGTRAINRFLLTTFDTSIADAFARSGAQPAMRGLDPNGFGYTSGTRPRIVYFASGVRNSTTDRYLPALISDSARATSFYGTANPVTYIVQAVHPFNGPFWEFWINVDRLETGKRYAWGLARYAVQQNGALDIAERLQTGNVTQPDQLVFRTGDFNPGGYLGTTNYGEACSTSPAAVAGANPHFLGSDVDAGGIEWDVTICQGTVWSTDFNQTNTPVPTNRAGSLNNNQYNFVVVWEADPVTGTPDYAKPVLRVQVGPLINTAGQVINNSFAPLPTAALASTALVLLPGGNGLPDMVTVSATNLPPLTNASYQVWFTKTGSDTTALATGRFYRLVNNVKVDSITSTNSFNGDTTTGSTFQMVIDYGTVASLGNFNSVVLVIAPAGGGATLPSSQPMWTGISTKVAGGATPSLASNLTFGNFDNGGTARAPWDPTGIGTGGVFGRLLDVQVTHLLRPPVGFVYNAYLRKAGTDTILEVGPLTGPFPDYLSLLDADVNLGGSVNAVEIVQAALRYQATSDTELCLYDRIDVRLEPKAKTGGIVGRTISVTGDNPAPTRQARCQ